MTRLLVLAAFAAIPLLAQDDVFGSELRQSWTRTINNAVAASEAMPEDKYNYKPAPESQSFRDLVAHTADSAMGTCTTYNGAPKAAGAAQMTKKADLVAAMKAARDECEKVYASFTDAKAGEMVEGRRGKRSRLGTLYGNTIHIEHEYAQMAVHLRANGVVPPSSVRR